MDDNLNPRERAAPTRKHNFIKDPSKSISEPLGVENSEEVLQKVTGKRFSLTEMFKRKSKKDTSNKEETNEEPSSETKEKQVESKDTSNKEEANEELCSETKEKQVESKDGE